MAFLWKGAAVDVEIPQNAVRIVTHTVSKEGLYPLFDALHADRNVIKIEHMRAGPGYEVTVHFAIMDLAAQLASVSASIEHAVKEANGATRDRS